MKKAQLLEQSFAFEGGMRHSGSFSPAPPSAPPYHLINGHCIHPLIEVNAGQRADTCCVFRRYDQCAVFLPHSAGTVQIREQQHGTIDTSNRQVAQHNLNAPTRNEELLNSR